MTDRFDGSVLDVQDSWQSNWPMFFITVGVLAAWILLFTFPVFSLAAVVFTLVVVGYVKFRSPEGKREDLDEVKGAGRDVVELSKDKVKALLGEQDFYVPEKGEEGGEIETPMAPGEKEELIKELHKDMYEEEDRD